MEQKKNGKTKNYINRNMDPVYKGSLIFGVIALMFTIFICYINLKLKGEIILPVINVGIIILSLSLICIIDEIIISLGKTKGDRDDN